MTDKGLIHILIVFKGVVFQTSLQILAGGEMADEDMREMVDAIQEAYLIAKKNNKKYTPKKYRKDE